MKNVKKLVKYILMITLLSVIALSGCKKKEKHKWIEIDPISTGSIITKYGVQDSKPAERNAPVILTAPIYVPLGLDKDGTRKYDKVLVELEELKPEYIDTALKIYGVITSDSTFCDLIIKDSDVTASAGPGAVDNKVLNKKGIVRYMDLASELDNSDNYVSAKDFTGLIDKDDVMHCLLTTFQENFQLVDCEFEPVTEDEYYRIHPDKKNK